MDWAIHLTVDGDKHAQIMRLLLDDVISLPRYWASHLFERENQPPQADTRRAGRPDHRFSHPHWHLPPYAWLRDWHYAMERVADLAVTDVRGVGPRTARWAEHGAHLWMDACAPSNVPWINPEVIASALGSGGATLWRGLLNATQDWVRETLDLPPVGADAYVPGKTVAVTPGTVVMREPMFELIRYAPDPNCAQVDATPLLIVPSWIMRYYILDLQPQDSLVRSLVAQGRQVYIMSWKNPGPQEADWSMQDYVVEGVLRAVDAVLADAAFLLSGSASKKAASIHLAGYCLGGTVAAVAAALLARQRRPVLASLTLLASLTDYAQPGPLGLLIDANQSAAIQAITESTGYLDGRMMTATFRFLNMRDFFWTRAVPAYLLGQHRPLNDLMAWNADTTRLPARMHAQLLQDFYLGNALARGQYPVDGHPVSLHDIQCPLFVVSTERDYVCPWESVYALLRLCDAETTFVLASGGHNVGIISPPLKKVDPNQYYRMSTRAANGPTPPAQTWRTQTPSTQGSWWTAWSEWLHQRAPHPIAAHTHGRLNAGLAPAPGRYVFER